MTDMEGDAMSHNQPNTTHSERLATPVNAHYAPGMEHAVEAAAKRFHEAAERLAIEFGYSPRDSVKPWEHVQERNRALLLAVCAELLEVGVLAPASLREEWTTADADMDSHTCCGDGDKAANEAHAERYGYSIVRRLVSDWLPVDGGTPTEAGNADTINPQNTIVLARDLAAARDAGYPRHKWCIVTRRNIEVAARGMQARYVVAVDLTYSEIAEIVIHDSVAPAFGLDGDPQILRVTAKSSVK